LTVALCTVKLAACGVGVGGSTVGSNVGVGGSGVAVVAGAATAGVAVEVEKTSVGTGGVWVNVGRRVFVGTGVPTGP